MKEFPKAYAPHAYEEKLYRFWSENGYFKPRKIAKRPIRGKKYVAWMAPPNITGGLHMGHALENTLLDVIIRKRRMEGYETLWVPGTDHAGIATQNVVEKELKKESLTRHDLGREKFEARVWEWRKKYGSIILEQFKKLGISPDWSRLVFTLDPGYAKAVRSAFVRYQKEGWVYYDRKVVNWCPRCATSISDLEVQHKDIEAKLWHINYPLKKGGAITVATTRPETMLGDTAIAVNPNDERYKNLAGKIAVLPIQNRDIPIVADAAVDPKFGTGAVKVTPAHDTTDYEISLRHKLPMIEVIDERAKMTKEAGKDYAGLSANDARKKVIEKLASLGLLRKTENYTMSASACDRCGSTIEPIPSWQWFVKMNELAKLGITPVKKGKTKLAPGRWAKPYLAWLKHVRDWPISRQLWWGHRLPVYYCSACKPNKSRLADNAMLSGSIEDIRRILNTKWVRIPPDLNYFVALTESNGLPRCPDCGSSRTFQSPDVLDTWFSSALWPFATLGWPQKTPDLARYYPGTLISSAPEILYLWIARMVFSGMYFMKKTPFALEYVHATVLTREGRRMSKSLGTGIDPLELILKYGADATRFGLIWQATGAQAVKFDEGVVLNGRKFANKLWNAARFIMIKTGGSNKKRTRAKPPVKNLSSIDKALVRDIRKIMERYDRDIERFRFGQAAEALYHFVWHNFCDKYLEYAKRETRKEVDEILLWALGTFLKLLHPMMPFVTEAIWQETFGDETHPLIIEPWPR